ncbi:hypothetical protein FOA52_006555 [Chlamydomonas sp. UWO 241]|nr:hypothetical protein FOA52_006555 [Chlamydomonas sp. UWO 241]
MGMQKIASAQSLLGETLHDHRQSWTEGVVGAGADGPQGIETDKLTKVAAQSWSASGEAKTPFAPALVTAIYNDELGGSGKAAPALRSVMVLEISQYLEAYLWPNFGAATATFEHVMSIVLMVNEKFRESVPAWACFHASSKDAFPDFFRRVTALGSGGEGERELKVHERTAFMVFTINVFQSLEDEMVRGVVLRLVSLPLWHALSPGRLQLELHAHPQLAKHWKALLKKEGKAVSKPGYVPPLERPEIAFIPSLLDAFVGCLEGLVVEGRPAKAARTQYAHAPTQAHTYSHTCTQGEGKGKHGGRRRSRGRAAKGTKGGPATAAAAAAPAADSAAKVSAAAKAKLWPGSRGAGAGAGVAAGAGAGAGAEAAAGAAASAETAAGADAEAEAAAGAEAAEGDAVMAEAAAGAAGEEAAATGGEAEEVDKDAPVSEDNDDDSDDEEEEGLGAEAEAEAAPAPALEPGPPRLDAKKLLYAERSLELLVDLLSQLPTRRFVRTLLEDRALLIKCKLCPAYRFLGKKADLFRQLVDLFQFYMAFPIDDHSGDPLTDDAISAAHYEKVTQLQRLAFAHVPKLKELALSNCGSVEKRDVLRRHLSALTEEELRFLTTRQLRLVSETDPWAQDKGFLQEVVLATYERRRFQCDVINEMPLYPTEGVLWDEAQIPSVNYSGESTLALPKLNLQFLTPHDYLLRNFNLFRLEATYEIREDVADVLQRVGGFVDEDDNVRFAGWARMGLPLTSFKIVEVRKPAVGENKPSAVTAELIVDTKTLRGGVKAEWDQVKQHDVLFLLSVRPPTAAEAQAMWADGEPGVADKYGLCYVRGCEVVEMKDEAGKLMNDFTGRVKPDQRGHAEGSTRTVTVAMDTAQYQLDINAMARDKSDDVYSSFNLLMRRKPKENNFKAVLESIRDLMNEEVIIPPWLHDIFLGYGDPGAAHYSAMEASDRLGTVDCKDTFLDGQHLVDSFPQYEVRFEGGASSSGASGSGASSSSDPMSHAPPYRLSFPEAGPCPLPAALGASAAQLPSGAGWGGGDGGKPVLRVSSYVPPDPGPYPKDQPRRNGVKFTPVQVEAIVAGVQPGLTMVVGPPGTGKTDTATQIMHMLYHNCPGQRTLLITHSNQALNDLFSKIMQRDVPSRYLLRLGMGEQELESDEDYSRAGRVNAMLARRLQLLAEVERLARGFGVAEDVSYTCETAAHFWLLHVLSRWERFTATVEANKFAEAVSTAFPFNEFFADAPTQLFAGASFDADMERARGCFRHLRTIFQELEEIRPFELLRGQGDRVNYLMSKQAKIVAMTCTHAALKRREFIEMAFKYDNLLMEEAAQILEIETFIPMLLQRNEDGRPRLKRVILIGDHHQLPPVVKNMAFQKFSHLDQSLFARFIRLGTPYVELNAQGRARPSMAALYNWRYRCLGDLPNVTSSPEYLAANAGFAHEYQFVDVGDYLGQGESEPTPYFYQNLGEAEYVVSMFCFMRLLGYPAHKISILTTYNGQKHLIRDVLERRCAAHPALGRPHKVTTVDKFQGQQNDYVLLSLVRSRIVGHLRDVRRLVVAMSRARLGLYAFGRRELFENCYELAPAFKQLLARPTKLALVKGESYGATSRTVVSAGAPTAAPQLLLQQAPQAQAGQGNRVPEAAAGVSPAASAAGAPAAPAMLAGVDLMEGPEQLADLVSRILAEQTAASAAAAAAALAAKQAASAEAAKAREVAAAAAAALPVPTETAGGKGGPAARAGATELMAE